MGIYLPHVLGFSKACPLPTLHIQSIHFKIQKAPFFHTWLYNFTLGFLILKYLCGTKPHIQYVSGKAVSIVGKYSAETQNFEETAESLSQLR